jgi:hypothetical protein
VTRERHARFYERRRAKSPPPTHHRIVHTQEWYINIVDAHPEFVPPRWLDPDQTPIRNTLHHPDIEHAA